MRIDRRTLLASTLFGLGAMAARPAHAQKKYDPGASDSEIKIGNIMPYSGPSSAWSINGKTEAAYFAKINSEGGIQGRKIGLHRAGLERPTDSTRRCRRCSSKSIIISPRGNTRSMNRPQPSIGALV